MQESRTTRAAAVLDCRLHLAVAGGEIETIGVEIIEVRAAAEIARHPAVRRLHRNTDAVVFTDVQHRRGQLLIRGPRRRVECSLRGGVIAGSIAERTDRDAVAGNRQGVADAAGVVDRNSGAQCFGQMRGDGGSLRQHPQRFAAPHLVATAAGRVFGAGRERQRRIHHRIHPRNLAEALGHESAGTVVQECRVGVSRQPRDHRIAFVTAAADRVEDLVLHAQHARHQIEMAADQLRLEQFAEPLRIERAAIKNSVVRRRFRLRPACPTAHEFLEIDVADLGAVQALHAGGDRIGHCCEHDVSPALAREGRCL